MMELLDREHNNQQQILFMRVVHRENYHVLTNIGDNMLISIIIILNKNPGDRMGRSLDVQDEIIGEVRGTDQGCGSESML